MNYGSRILWFKIIGWAVLMHIILIALSILEVFIFSLIKPDQTPAFYEEHAELSGPYVSIIFGFFLFYIVARLLSKKHANNKLAIAIFLPIIYTIMDFLIVHFYEVNWEEHYMIFIISFLVKVLGAFWGAYSVRKGKT